MQKVHFEDLGVKDYKDTWNYQEEIFYRVIEEKRKSVLENKTYTPEHHILFVEHPHVYTLGKSGDENNLLLDDHGLAEKDATYYKINRGGDITYHGPGQLVVYPILDLDYFFTDIHRYLRTLEEAVILTLEEYQIKAGRLEGYTGVWLESDSSSARKICAMGVKTSRWVTMHGIGFNVNTDLSYFDNIVPCGIEDRSVTSMQRELGKEVNINEVKSIVQENLATLFDFDWV